MANVRRRISELTALTSASLDTTLVGVDGGTTYKIELDTLADAVTARVNILDRSRLSALETYTASFSASANSGTISSSAQISALGFISSSTQTDISALNAFTYSFNSFSSSVHNEIVAATNEQDLSGYVTDLVYNVLSESVDIRLDNIEANTGSYLTSLNGSISSSSQLTSSYDSRYVLSGSITQTTWDNIANKPSGIVSQSTDLSSLNTFTQSIDSRVDNLESWSSSLTDTFATDLEVSIVSSSVAATIAVVSTNIGLVTTSSFNSYTASISTGSLVNRLNTIESATSSYEIKGSGIISGAAQINTLGYAKLVGGNTFYNEQTFSSNVNVQGNLSSSVIDNLNVYTASLKNTISVSGVGTASVTTILGNLHIEGTTTTVSASNLSLTNNFIYLNDDNFVINPDLGIAGNYNDGTYAHSGIFSDASDNHTWKVFKGYTIEPSQSIDTNHASFELADFKANNIYGTINASNGVISGSSQLSGKTIQNLSGSFTGSYTGSFSGSFKGPLDGVAAYASTVATVTTNTTTDTTLYPLFSETQSPNSYISLRTHASGSFYYDGVTRRVHAEGFSGSIFATNGVVSGSAQITSLGFISSSTTPAGTISSSAQITSLGFVSGSYLTSLSGAISSSTQVLGGTGIYSSSAQLPSGLISGSSQLTASYDIRYAPSASYLTSLNGAISSSSQILNGSGIYSSSAQLPNGLISGSSQLTASYDTRYTLSGSVSSTPAGTISGSSQLTSSFDTRYTLSGSVQPLPSNLVSSSAQITAFGFISSSTTIPTGTISGSSQLTSSFDLRYAISASYLTSLNGAISSSNQLTSSFELKGSGIYSSSVQLPSGLISGSSQLTASYDIRYAPSASYLTTLNGAVSSSSQITASLDLRYQLSGSAGVVPIGTVSSSVQLTSSYDGRYVQTGSYNSYTASINTFTSSYNLWTSSIATTGSNSFNGNQTVTGSLIVSSVATISSSIAANASSLTLSSGSNLYIQNNGLAEITGSLNVSGSTTFTGSISISSGSITMPNRPAFRITGAGGPTAATTVLSGSMVVVDYNEGNHYNTTNGTFTAPIAGLYQVNLVCRTYSNSAGASQAVVVKNNTAGSNGTVQIMLEWAANTTVNHMGGSTISKLAVGDTLKAVIFMGTSSFDGNDNFSVAYIG